jgi:UTP--glucose-1-phosphate uridylyltransferase
MEIKKAIIPVAGFGTRFLPLSKVVPKELWPLVDIPIIQYIINEAKEAGIKEIIFVVKPKEKVFFDYFKPAPHIEKILKDRKKSALLAELKNLEDLLRDVNFTYVTQRKPLGDGHALLQAAKLINDEPVASLFADDIVESKTPCLAQLSQVFRTCQKPILALYRLPQEQLPKYGIVGVEKIARRLFKVKKIVEKPALDKAPSDLAIVGKHILTPEVFAYLRKAEPSEKGEIILAEVLNKMLDDGKVVYGYEFEGKWLECGNKMDWLKTNLYLSLKHPQFGPELKKYLKEII